MYIVSYKYFENETEITVNGYVIYTNIEIKKDGKKLNNMFLSDSFLSSKSLLLLRIYYYNSDIKNSQDFNITLVSGVNL